MKHTNELILSILGNNLDIIRNNPRLNDEEKKLLVSQAIAANMHKDEILRDFKEKNQSKIC